MFCLLLPSAASAQQWQLLPDQSSVKFTASYDDIAFDGQFEKFSLQLYFDPDEPGTGRLSSSVNTASVNTNSRDRDEALADPDWFHFSAYPQATFVSHQFTKVDEKTFQVSGKLTIRDQPRDISFPFKWQMLNTNQVRVNAQFPLDRRDFNIGAGEWREDETIGFAVEVKISLVLTRQL